MDFGRRTLEGDHAAKGHGGGGGKRRSFGTVGGIPITELLSRGRIDAIVQRMRDGAAVTEMVEAILKDKKKILSCAAYLNGEYGVKGFYMGLPVKLGRGGIEHVIEIKLAAEDQAAFDKSAAAVCELLDKVNL